MTWSCQECDYLGEEIIETDEHDEGCPECRGYCIELNEMTDEQYRQLRKFYEDGDFIEAQDKLRDEAPYKYLWDDFIALSDFMNTVNREIFVYTIVDCEDGEAWLLEGTRYVNRIGYLLSKVKIDIPEEGLRYW